MYSCQPFFSRHFDKDKSGKLNHQEFKSCLRALGYDLPMVEEGQRDPEFEAILDMVDPNRYGIIAPVLKLSVGLQLIYHSAKHNKTKQ